jgi:hypothetical protein
MIGCAPPRRYISNYLATEMDIEYPVEAQKYVTLYPSRIYYMMIYHVLSSLVRQSRVLALRFCMLTVIFSLILLFCRITAST